MDLTPFTGSADWRYEPEVAKDSNRPGGGAADCHAKHRAENDEAHPGVGYRQTRSGVGPPCPTPRRRAGPSGRVERTFRSVGSASTERPGLVVRSPPDPTEPGPLDGFT